MRKRSQVKNKGQVYILVLFISIAIAGVYMLYRFAERGTFGTVEVFRSSEKETTISEVSDIQQKEGILILGDVMLDRLVRNKISEHGPEYPFSDIRDFFLKRELVVLNLEGPVTDFDSKTIDYRNKALQFTFDPAMVPKLVEYGVGLVGLANNHTLNFGVEGLGQTHRYLSYSNLPWYGDPRNVASTTYKYISKDGVRVGFVGYHQFTQDQTTVFKEIAGVRNDVDILVVSPHWGEEYERYPTEFQKRLARKFIDYGADIVIGAHPHVIQTLEVYKKRPIFYSLGNFIFDQDFSYATTRGLGVEFIPTVQTMTSSRKFLLHSFMISKGHVQRVLDSESQKIFASLAEDSFKNGGIEENYLAQIKDGFLEIKF